MTPRSPRSAGKPLAFGSAVTTLLFASLALAADAPPLDKASEQVSIALTSLKDVKLGNKQGDEHLDKARAYLVRARAELLKAQGQVPSE
jgi:hypothetical protein